MVIVLAETVKVEVDLDLNPKLAKEKLDDFKKSVKDEKIPVKLDLDNVKGDALKLKNVLSDAFIGVSFVYVGTTPYSTFFSSNTVPS